MKQLPSIDTNADTFYSWIVKTNAIINLCNTEVVTANNHANGAITTGKGYVIGTFGSNTIVADTIRGGNTIANAVLTVTSNTIFTDNVIRIDKGLTLGANSIVHDHGVRFVHPDLVARAIDTFPAATYRAAKYVVSITDTVGAQYQTTELLLVHDGTTTYTTEYATLITGASLGVLSSDITTGNVRLIFDPTTVSNLQINISRTLIAV